MSDAILHLANVDKVSGDDEGKPGSGVKIV